jgi:predicted RNase H-like HicB family nuclease
MKKQTKKVQKKQSVKDLIHRLTYRVEWSEEDNVHIAIALELPSIQAHGNSPEKALHEVEVALELALDWMIEKGEKLPEPISLRKFKGDMMVRTSPEKHRDIAMRAAESGVSINQYILSKIG